MTEKISFMERSEYMTEEGGRGERELPERYRIPNQELRQRFEFREIRREEAEEAADIEQICFPPHEACSRSMMHQRV